MRILMLANYFPMPTNEVMGTWALSQARAIQRQGGEVLVIAFISWVPKVLAVTKGAKKYSRCELSYSWEGLPVEYPRWPLYSVGPFRYLGLRHPEVQLELGWLAIKSKLLRRVSSYSPDIVFAHHTGANGYLAWRLQKETGLPYVVTDHDFGEITACAKYPHRLRMFRKVMGNAARCIAVASRMEQDIRGMFPQARTITVWNGADPIPLEMKQSRRPAELQDRLVVFSCGHFYQRKGFPLLVRAFGRIAGEIPEAILRIAGDGPERAKIEAQIRSLGLEGRVQLLGHISNREVWQQMCWCDVFAMIGWLEPFGVVFAEAFSAGKPVVCCEDAGFMDVMENGTTGFAVPPQDEQAAAWALRRLLEDRGLRELMGQSAISRFESWLSWDHNAGTMLKIFEAALGEHQPRFQRAD